LPKKGDQDNKLAKYLETFEKSILSPATKKQINKLQIQINGFKHDLVDANFVGNDALVEHLEHAIQNL
jgi:hypothetical protein